MSAGDWAREMADSYAKIAEGFEAWPDTARNRLGATANRAEEAKYRRIAQDMDEAFPEPAQRYAATHDAQHPQLGVVVDGERERYCTFPSLDRAQRAAQRWNADVTVDPPMTWRSTVTGEKLDAQQETVDG